MKGTVQIPFIELFADTVSTHGAKWAHAHYRRAGMAEWEFAHWLKAARNTGRI